MPDVTQDSASDAQLLFAVADATWRCEAAKVLGRRLDDPDLTDISEARGDPDTLLRTAYDVRDRAYAEWRRLREAVG